MALRGKEGELLKRVSALQLAAVEELASRDAGLAGVSSEARASLLDDALAREWHSEDAPKVVELLTAAGGAGAAKKRRPMLATSGSMARLHGGSTKRRRR